MGVKSVKPLVSFGLVDRIYRIISRFLSTLQSTGGVGGRSFSSPFGFVHLHPNRIRNLNRNGY